MTALKEHRDFEKEFEINTKYEGEKALGKAKVKSPHLAFLGIYLCKK